MLTWLVKELRELLAPFITLLFDITECFASEMTYTVPSGTLNPSTSYHIIPYHPSLNKPLFVRSWKRAGWVPATWRTTGLYPTCHSSPSCRRGWVIGDFRCRGFRCTSSGDRTSTSSQHVRVAGICCRWSNDVQRSARWSMRSRSQHNIRTTDEDTPFFCLSARLEH